MKTEIKPLVWKGKLIQVYDSIDALTPFGTYYIKKYEDGRIVWGYCFDEYFDEGEWDVDSIKEGKIKAWENWVDRVTPIFKQITS